MKTPFMLVLSGGMLAGLLIWQSSTPQLARSQEGPKTAKVDSKDLDSLKATAGEFEKAYNAGNAKAIAAQFTANAEVIDEEGNVTQGRDAIEARFAELFKEHPKSRISTEVTSLRQLSPDVAVEDGFSTTTLDPDEPPSRSPYTLIHVRRDGKWLVASVRDFPEDSSEPTTHQQLQVLEWLVGHWVDESPEGRVETTCHWSDDGNYLMQEYLIHSRRGKTLKGSQRIAWDPVEQTVRSWAFDQSGAFTEAIWTPVDDFWILQVKGATADGHRALATRTLTPIGDDSFQISTTNMLVGGELLADSTVKVVRRPPAPKE